MDTKEVAEEALEESDDLDDIFQDLNSSKED